MGGAVAIVGGALFVPRAPVDGVGGGALWIARGLRRRRWPHRTVSELARAPRRAAGSAASVLATAAGGVVWHFLLTRSAFRPDGSCLGALTHRRPGGWRWCGWCERRSELSACSRARVRALAGRRTPQCRLSPRRLDRPRARLASQVVAGGPAGDGQPAESPGGIAPPVRILSAGRRLCRSALGLTRCAARRLGTPEQTRGIGLERRRRLAGRAPTRGGRERMTPTTLDEPSLAANMPPLHGKAQFNLLLSRRAP